MIIKAKSASYSITSPIITVPRPRFKNQVASFYKGITLDVATDGMTESYKFQKIKTLKFVNPVIANVVAKQSLYTLIPLKNLQLGEVSWNDIILGNAYFNKATGKIEIPDNEQEILYSDNTLIGGEAIEYIVRNYITPQIIRDVLLKALELSNDNEEMTDKQMTVCDEMFPATAYNVTRLNKIMSSNKADLFQLYRKPELLLNPIQEVIYILPELYRPSSIDRKDPMTEHYNRLISANNTLMSIVKHSNTSINIVLNYYKNVYSHIVDIFKTSKTNDPSYKTLIRRLSTKFGLIRSNMIGTRCDYTARTVITVDKDMPSGYIGLPRKVAASIYENVLMNELLLDSGELSQSKIEDYLKNKTIDEIERSADILNGAPVLIGRQPTLFYLGIQLRKIQVIDGLAMVMSPLDVTAFAADFDGDAMHITALTDAKRVRDNNARPIKNGEEYEWTSEESKPFSGKISFFYPKDGKPTIEFRHEILYGLYKGLSETITSNRCFRNIPNEVKDYDTLDSVIYAFNNNRLSPDVKVPGKSYTYFQACIGFALNFPESDYDKVTKYEMKDGQIVTNAKGEPKQFDFTKRVTDFIKVGTNVHSPEGLVTAEDWYRYAVNILVQLGFAISKYYPPCINMISNNDIEQIAPGYYDKIKQIREDIYNTQDSSLYRDNDKSRAKLAFKVIDSEDSKIKKQLDNGWTDIIKSGARGKMINIQQSFLNKGSIGHCSDSIRSNIVLSNYTNGLTSIESFISANGGRADLIAKNISAAGPGYLARLMAFDASDIYINGSDCETELTFDFDIEDIAETQEHIKHGTDASGKTYLVQDSLKPFMQSFLIGRTIRDNNSDMYITKSNFDNIFNKFLRGEQIHLYSPIFCDNRCCRKCYGDDIRGFGPLKEGTRIGLMSAQSVAEPMTQMTMKLFQSGGVERSGDLDSDIDKVLAFFSGTKSAKADVEVENVDSGVEDDQEDQISFENSTYRDIVLKTLNVINIYWRNEHKVNMKCIEVVMSSFIKFIDAHNPGPGTVRRKQPSDLLMFYGIKRVSHKSDNFMNRISLESLVSSISSSLLYDNLNADALIEKEAFGII